MSKRLAVLDIEVLPNYFLVSLKGLESGNTLEIDMFGQNKTLSKAQRKRLYKALDNLTTFGFNSINYDMPLINYALTGATCQEIYRMSASIIRERKQAWMVYRKLDIEPYNFDHFDVSEPSPAVMISLKNYGTRIGSPKLQEFYLDPHAPILSTEIPALKEYCMNDLNVTIDLYRAIEDRINLRKSMSEKYGLDLRSKSDAQIAEAVITSELKKVGVSAFKPNYSEGYKPRYKAPDYIHFESPELKQLVKDIESMEFTLAKNGAVKMPLELKNKKITIGETTYQMGIGGLHSTEKSLVRTSNSKYVMRNADFTSYYPFIILKQGLAPKHLGEKFLDVYREIVETRLKAKAEGDKLVADSLKITINGSFGKFGSKYSKLYSPDLLLATTITGQLTLLMLIEELENEGISVVSANTDGLEYYCERSKVQLAEAIIFDLEMASGYEMEHGEYEGLYARDVNNYVAIYEDHAKAKGIYAETTLSKGRSTPIVYEAVREYLLKGTPIKTTITQCENVNNFVSARTVKGGGEWKGEYLGKMVRWYYSTEGSTINYKSNGNQVPKTGEGNGVKPMMDLTSEIPEDLDYEWYFNEAKKALEDLGVKL